MILLQNNSQDGDCGPELLEYGAYAGSALVWKAGRKVESSHLKAEKPELLDESASADEFQF